MLYHRKYPHIVDYIMVYSHEVPIASPLFLGLISCWLQFFPVFPRKCSSTCKWMCCYKMFEVIRLISQLWACSSPKTACPKRRQNARTLRRRRDLPRSCPWRRVRPWRVAGLSQLVFTISLRTGKKTPSLNIVNRQINEVDGPFSIAMLNYQRVKPTGPWPKHWCSDAFHRQNEEGPGFEAAKIGADITGTWWLIVFGLFIIGGLLGIIITGDRNPYEPSSFLTDDRWSSKLLNWFSPGNTVL